MILNSSRLYGGQAVIEGVMMRGKRAMAIAVRNSDDEIIVYRQKLVNSFSKKMSEIPLLRGVVGLVDAFGLGVRSLMYSASIAEGEEASYDAPIDVWSIVFSVGIGLSIFFVLPTLIAQIGSNLGELTGLGINIIEGFVRLCILMGYVSIIGLLPDIRRVYGYHGAEHKTINAYEDNVDLTVENVAKYSCEHPRCGTGFLLIVVVFSVVIFALLGPMSLTSRIITRLALVPFLASIAYEYIRFTARNQHLYIIRVLMKPSLLLQRLTTREPDEGMLRVAIEAFSEMKSLEDRLAE